MRCVVDKKQWVEVGSQGSPDRRAHWVEVGPLWIRSRVDGLEGATSARAFLTYHDLRRATSSGMWSDRRQRSAVGLRPAAEIVPQHDPTLTDILTGLSLAEATVLVGYAGGRLPTQKELDIILERVPDLRSALQPGVCLWTSSVHGPFDYSHCRFNLVQGRWEADDQVKPLQMRPISGGPAVGATLQSVIEPRAGQVIRHAASTGAREIKGDRGANLRPAALLVMPASSGKAV